MAGLPQNNATRRREHIIEQWMLAVSQDGGIDRFDCLHVDRIDATWKSRDLWIEAGLEAYRLAVGVRDRHGLRLSVVLAFPLIAADEPKGVDFGTTEQLAGSLNWMPPALYLFRPGDEFWNQTETTKDGREVARDIVVTQLDPRGVFPAAGFKTCRFMEFQPVDSKEYSRSVFFAG